MEKEKKKKEIIHLCLYTSDFTFCGHADEQLGERGEILDNDFKTVMHSVKDLYVKPKWNTTCRDCQAAIKCILGQIKKP